MYRGRHLRRENEIHQRHKISWPEILVAALMDLIVGIVLIFLEDLVHWLAHILLR